MGSSIDEKVRRGSGLFWKERTFLGHGCHGVIWERRQEGSTSKNGPLTPSIAHPPIPTLPNLISIKLAPVAQKRTNTSFYLSYDGPAQGGAYTDYSGDAPAEILSYSSVRRAAPHSQARPSGPRKQKPLPKPRKPCSRRRPKRPTSCRNGPSLLARAID
jgi:hypothetical protein